MKALQDLKNKYFDKLKFELNSLPKSNSHETFGFIDDMMSNVNTLKNNVENVANGIGKEFIKEINSKEYSNFSEEEKEKANNELQRLVVDYVVQFSDDFVMGK